MSDVATANPGVIARGKKKAPRTWEGRNVQLTLGGKKSKEYSRGKTHSQTKLALHQSLAKERG